ncbi:PAS domain-containing sensor histidine kinase [Muribaculum gordoncarteri]|jgi:nitrogen fixation/metabolism regulation signal transduction histidine kinase|uniref:histidine kinase n=5 Tax=Muribaculum TaxID=1918540 RepID=A0A4P7VPW5_9BACT|nr:ATP-binding protein [Muribaculum gordoncarteri]QCD36238.1 PAS domain-containing protein [Muribaculum gordoncarteri]
MKLRWMFALVALMVIAAGVILAMTLNEVSSQWVVYIVEGIMLFCLVVLLLFYRTTMRLIRSVSNGMDLLREQDFSSRLAHVNQREADRIVDVFNRMMDSLKNERLKLREQNHFLDLLIGASPMGILIFDQSEVITMGNKAAASFFGYDDSSDLIGRKLIGIPSPLAAVIKGMQPETIETVRLSNSKIYRCSRLSFMDSGYAHPFVLIEHLTSEMVKAEKKAYEKVIRMIAHEVNNSVAGVNSTLDTVASMLEEESDDALHATADVLRVCQERCLTMSRFITSYADVVKIPEANLMLTDLNERVYACKEFMESMCNERDIRLHVQLCDECVQVKIDNVLFEQALVNILKNAIESIGSDGDVYITTTAKPATLTIADNGAGISPDIENKLFSPFFSSKPDGQGLGLIFISDVLTKHNCLFSLRTFDDGLTRFSIRFK